MEIIHAHTAKYNLNKRFAMGRMVVIKQILLPQVDIYSFLYKSMRHLYELGDVHCNGFAGCSYSWLQSAGIVYCGGRDACKWTTIFNANELFSYGSFGAVSSIVMHTPSVYGFGYYSLAFADIDSLNIDIDIRLLGWNAGYFANIICRSGSTCS
eukprot:124285_1